LEIGGVIMKVDIIGLLSETSIHPGSESSTGVVDLPIAREVTTDYPVITGSSLKGAFRERFEDRKDKKESDKIFGEQNRAGDTTYECKEDDKENHPVRPPKENTISITRNEFIDIVKKAISMPELTFQEKGKLNELWDTFKEFNRDILTSILEDLSQKTNDFSRNFLYYIAQIRNLYLEKLSGFKEENYD
jgi:CRISPR type III-B/RAMP module RAMP protein Cmr4